MIKTLSTAVHLIYQRLALAGFSMLVLIVGWQVFARYVLNNSPSWSEPLAMLLLLYSVMLGTAVGVRNNYHLGLSWFLERFSSNTQHWLRHLQHWIVGSFGIAMAIYGVQMAMQTWAYIIPGLPLPMGVQYLALLFAGSAIALFAIEALTEHISGGKSAWS